MQKSVLKKFIESFIHKKSRASSIVEVIVALAICLIIFLISMSVIVNSQRSNNIRLKQKAQFILSTIDSDSLFQGTNQDYGSLRIEKSIQECDTIEGLSIISYSAFDNAGHKIGMKVIWVATAEISLMDLTE